MSGPRLTELALFTSNVVAVTEFYERILGVDPAPGDPPADDRVAFTVTSLDDHAAGLTAAGVELDGPRDLP